jgi:hypothetical protein
MSEKPKYSEEILAYLNSITAKRARTVIQHILKHGFITTDDLQNTYGYTHAPRATMDVKDVGIPLETYSVISGTSGRSIGAYRFGDLTHLEKAWQTGRNTFSKTFKHELFVRCNGRCQICNGEFTERSLQVDHRVPYGVAGDAAEQDYKDFMMLCGSCNRAKSWSCEHCENFLTIKNPDHCQRCYWGSPEDYHHIALHEMRRLDITWTGKDVEHYDILKAEAEREEVKLPEFFKALINKAAKDLL